MRLSTAGIRVVPREEWGARPPRSVSRMAEKAKRLWIHHTAGEFDIPTAPKNRDGKKGKAPEVPRPPKWYEKLLFSKACAYVRMVQAYHMDSRKYVDVAYSWGAMPMIGAAFGRKMLLFELRGWGVVGGHTYGDNEESLGLVLLGNYETRRFPKIFRKRIRAFIDYAVDYGHLAGPRKSQPTGGHQDAREIIGEGTITACPGKNVEAKIADLRRPIPKKVEERRRQKAREKRKKKAA